MNDKLVTHEDLATLRELHGAIHDPERGAAADALIDRLIAAAEADTPPLPEGWVTLRLVDGSQRVLWHHDGLLSVVSTRTPFSTDHFGMVEGRRDRLTPLRPTVTEADVEKAALAISLVAGVVPWEHLSGDGRERWLTSARAAFAAAGIEVQS